ncbi:MAG: hypothetical protein M3285_03035 [Actinomycetota bacterium]|nr:hypothetical protein [Actinomycetota bacterium]
MNQRAVVLVADYLSKRPKGRIVRIRREAEDDYLLAIEDRRDGRVQLIQSVADLEAWIQSFQNGTCLRPVGAICGVCDDIHSDRDLDGELFSNCVGCQVELLDVAIDLAREGEDWL